jgi:hypothetical protein
MVDLPQNRTEIVVDHSLSLEELPNLAQALVEALQQSVAGVRLAIATGEVSMPLIQLICAVHRSAQTLDKEFAVAWQVPTPVAALLQNAGFTRHVACPRSQSGECLWLQQHWS